MNFLETPSGPLIANHDLESINLLLFGKIFILWSPIEHGFIPFLGGISPNERSILLSSIITQKLLLTPTESMETLLEELLGSLTCTTVPIAIDLWNSSTIGQLIYPPFIDIY